MRSLNGVKNMKRFVVVRAEGYMTSRPANLLTSVNSLNKKSAKIYCRVQLSIRQL